MNDKLVTMNSVMPTMQKLHTFIITDNVDDAVKMMKEYLKILKIYRKKVKNERRKGNLI